VTVLLLLNNMIL